MPTKVEKDSVTGTETTGHEWDGIKELNTPLPRWWLYLLYATIAFSLVYYVLYPTVPGFDGLLDTITDHLTPESSPQEDYPAISEILINSFETMQETLSRYKLAANPPDLLISIPRNICAAHEFFRASELIDAGELEADVAKRHEIYDEAQRIVYEEAPAIFLFLPEEVEACHISVQNWVPSSDSRENMHDVWLSE